MIGLDCEIIVEDGRLDACDKVPSHENAVPVGGHVVTIYGREIFLEGI